MCVGMNGEHATASTAGRDAKTVHVNVSRPDPSGDYYSPSAVFLTIDTHPHQCVVPRPHSKEKVEMSHDLGTSGRLFFSAKGGDGGRGGKGGNGQGGGHGRDGADANLHVGECIEQEHSDSCVGGQNGESGGNGGNGGDASSGSPGGRGGYIKIVVKEEDTDLLVCLEPPNVSGGKGGKGGKNGEAGKGGMGGRGGDSYTW